MSARGMTKRPVFTIKDHDDLANSSPGSRPEKSTDSASTVPMSVTINLFACTAAMIVVPIGSYFLTIDSLFRGNSTYAGALAAVMANVVLGAYIVLAMNEERSEQKKAADETKKTR